LLRYAVYREAVETINQFGATRPSAVEVAEHLLTLNPR
jgi:hypothetical protein